MSNVLNVWSRNSAQFVKFIVLTEHCQISQSCTDARMRSRPGLRGLWLRGCSSLQTQTVGCPVLSEIKKHRKMEHLIKNVTIPKSIQNPLSAHFFGLQWIQLIMNVHLIPHNDKVEVFRNVYKCIMNQKLQFLNHGSIQAPRWLQIFCV